VSEFVRRVSEKDREFVFDDRPVLEKDRVLETAKV
jgi:hypothetical protein